ncbi:MAG TPA: YfbU family protein [Bradyrhizobium sp.]|nr:YfbU family protein [Bradyrhizobium sp.]
MMVPKTERFELRLDPSILERMDGWRGDQPDLPSRAEAVRRLIEEGLSARSEKNFVLNNQEKLVVWLLTEVLKNQKGDEDQDTVRLIQDAIYGGHFWALPWELSGVLHNHVDSHAALTLVLDVLEMWWFIEDGYSKFTPIDKVRVVSEVGEWAKDPKFPGFDGNSEGEYMSIAKFLVEKLDRFEEFKGRSFNSHHPTLSRYRNMVALFEGMRAHLGVGNRLGASDVIKLLQAR